MASLDQQLQEALAAINGLTEKVQSLTSNLNTLWNENQALCGQRPASAYVILSLAWDIYNSLQDIHCNSFVAGIIILEISM